MDNNTENIKARFLAAFKIWQLAQAAHYFKIGASNQAEATLRMTGEEYYVNSSLDEQLASNMEAMAEGMEAILRRS